MWTGLFSATKICQGNAPNTWKPLLNLDRSLIFILFFFVKHPDRIVIFSVAYTAFIKKTSVIEFMCEVLEGAGGGGGRGGPPHRGPPGQQQQQRGPNIPQRELNPMQLEAFKRAIKGSYEFAVFFSTLRS